MDPPSICSEKVISGTAPIDDRTKIHHEKNSTVAESKEHKCFDSSSNISSIESVDVKIVDTNGEGKTTDEASNDKKLTIVDEIKKQVLVKSTLEGAIKSLDGSSSLNSNKKNHKQLDPSNTIKTPNVHDVLLGRGKPFQNHDGNQSMLRIVDMYRKRYHESERAFKHEIIEEVLDIIKSKGGRFLERIDDFEKSFWNQVPHRMAYRKVGHAFRSNARRISMEKRGQAQNQRRNTSSMARASMVSQLITDNETMMQRMPMQGVSLPEMMPVGGALGLANAMGIGGSVYNDGGACQSLLRQGGAALNQTQRELLAQEQMLHSSRIERILGNSRAGSTSPHRLDSVQSMLSGGDSLPFAMGGGNIGGRSLQINDMRRMMLLGSGSIPNHPNPFHLTNSGTASASRIPNMGISNIGNVGDSHFKMATNDTFR